MDDESDEGTFLPPPPRGVRLRWEEVPPATRHQIEAELGSTVVAATTIPTGFSPGVAARLTLADGRQVFAKAVGPKPNPESPAVHRREAQIVPLLPPETPVPRLLFSWDEGEGGWVVLVFEYVQGGPPRQPWQAHELSRVLHAMVGLSELLTPSPIPPPLAGTAAEAFATRLCGWQRLLHEHPSRLEALDAWSLRHLGDLARLEREAATGAMGETLLHFDLRADNLLLTPQQVWIVDWPHVCVGAAWVDVVLFAPSVAMQGGPPPEEVVARHPAYQMADPAAVTAVIAAMAGFFTHRSVQPTPPGLPTLRAFQAAQGAVARRWLARRTGWR